MAHGEENIVGTALTTVAHAMEQESASIAHGMTAGVQTRTPLAEAMLSLINSDVWRNFVEGKSITESMYFAFRHTASVA